jgi:protein-histidine pros-kinase
MKLLAKFNLILGVVFLAGFLITGWVAHDFLQDNAKKDVTRQARLMMEAARSVRDYTTNQVKPLLQKEQLRLDQFLPQTVPAFSAVETFAYLRSAYPDYTYREATLNPTNLRDRATDWEADVINAFRNNPSKSEIVGERSTPTGQAYYLAKPMRAVAPCLECHDSPQRAPAAMIRQYGPSNGFGWHGNEVVAAQIVTVPESLPVEMADRSFRTLMTSIGLIFLSCLALLDLVLVMMVVRPLRNLSAQADRISTGDMSIPELRATGKDEIAILAGSFNRMRRSLERALKMLEGE